MKKRVIKLRHRLVQALELPAEAVEGLPRIRLLGREHMLVENHTGVYEYRPEQIRLMSREGLLRVSGRGLVLRELSRERLYIGGEIDGFAFESREST